MHTIWVRLNAVVFFGLTVLLGMSCLAALSKVGHSYRSKPCKFCLDCAAEASCNAIETKPFFPVVEVLEMTKLKSLKSHGGVDRALLSFDLKVDLAPAFHWNIKQLFVFVVAQYETDGRTNQVVLWDKIVEASDPKIIDESNVFVKYALVDQGTGLRGKNVKLQLRWDHMPITGFLHMDGQPLESTSSFNLPIEYQ